MKQAQLNALATKLDRQIEGLNKTLAQLVAAGAAVRPKPKKKVKAPPAPPAPPPPPVDWSKWQMPPEGTKAYEAVQVYKELNASGGRSAVITAFKDRLGLSPAGAMTYYMNLRMADTHGRLK